MGNTIDLHDVDVKDFIRTVESCKGNVYLETGEGDRFNLKSKLSQIMGLTPTGVKITSARTRYGSCSSKNSLCFSCFLMNAPEEAIDLVVVHELCHIRHKNHGPAFYALLASVLPDHRQRKQLLKNVMPV